MTASTVIATRHGTDQRQIADEPVAPPAGGTYDQPDSSLGDVRFRTLLSEHDWASLSPAIRRRFSKRLAGGCAAVYVGSVTEMAMSRAGFVLAHLARLIGGPLPTSCDVDVPCVVTVTEDTKRDRGNGGQVWTRLYARRAGFPQTIHSAKRFGGSTGLEEHVGCGIGMTLTVLVEAGALIFTSERYFIGCGGMRMTLPTWLGPGKLRVTHTEVDAIRFAFTLDIVHPWLGRLLHQRAVFEEVSSRAPTTERLAWRPSRRHELQLNGADVTIAGSPKPAPAAV